MKTQVVRADQEGAVQRAAEVLKAGGLVAFPTETVYGLGANALDAEAVAKIFAAKGRPAHNPLIVHLPDAEAAAKDAGEWPEAAARLASCFWPGPLTLVLPRSGRIPDIVTAGGPTVGLRVPAHPVALSLLRAAGVPVAAPSANRSLQVSPTCAEHVLEGMDGRIDLILDGGATSGGLESTVLDLTTAPPALLRPGLLTPTEIEAVIGPIHRPGQQPLPDPLSPLRAPGQLARHYAPRAPLELHPDGRRRVLELVALGEQVGWLRYHFGSMAQEPEVSGRSLFVVQMPSSADAYATRLYAELHALDRTGVTRIIVDRPPDTEAWLAIHDRLRRASTQE